ncbi:YARHG domain-containing protein [Butyrivibrio sp. NC3005]|uniref:YARHG domain-containing protein n=1 Tax=Butyrivibrio sp. NC3005 TaxID=1280685 RepID=UPI003FA47E77
MKYTKSDLENEPKLILNLGKNEIYARHGYIFKDENIENYFLGQIWYVPTTFPEDFDDSCFSETERQNLELFNELCK